MDTPSLSSAQIRAARWAVAAMFLMHGLALSGFASYLPLIKERLHLTAAGVGGTIMFTPLGSVAALPFVGVLLARFGTRRVLTVTAAGLFCLVPFVIGAPNAWALRGILLVYGACGAVFDSAMNAEAVAVQKLYPTPIMSSSHGLWSLGGFAGGGLVALTRQVGLDPIAHVTALSSLLLLGLWLVERFLLPHAEPDSSGPLFSWPRGILLLIGVLTMLAMGSEGVGFDWVAIYLRDSLKTSEATAAVGFSLFSGGMALSRLFGDIPVHRLGPQKVLLLCGIMAPLGYLVGVTAPWPAVSIGGFLLAGLGIANVVPIMFQLAGSVKGVAAGSGIAAVSLMGYGMFFLAPPLVGAVADRTSLPFALGCLGCGVAGVAVFGPRVVAKTS